MLLDHHFVETLEARCLNHVQNILVKMPPITDTPRQCSQCQAGQVQCWVFLENYLPHFPSHFCPSLSSLHRPPLCLTYHILHCYLLQPCSGLAWPWHFIGQSDMSWFVMSLKISFPSECWSTKCAWELLSSMDWFYVCLKMSFFSECWSTLCAWELLSFMDWFYVCLKISLPCCFVFTM